MVEWLLWSVDWSFRAWFWLGLDRFGRRARGEDSTGTRYSATLYRGLRTEYSV